MSMLKRLDNFLVSIFAEDVPLKQTTPIWYLIAGIGVLVYCGLHIYAGLENHMDIQFADEAAYLRFGLDLPGHLNRDWGPLYAIWYKLLSFITTDTIKLYYLNFRLTAIIPPVLLLLFLWRMGVDFILTFFISYCVLVSEANISVWPRISQFCMIILLSGLILSTYFKNKFYKLLLLTLVTLLCSYARPEFYLAFILLLFITILSGFYQPITFNKKTTGWIIFYVFIIASLHLFFRFPSNNFFGFNRGVAAFYQHYAFNLRIQHKLDVDAWLGWEDLANSTFGNCNSMLCVIINQPKIFMLNTLFNIKNYIAFTFVSVGYYLFPLIVFHSKMIKLLIVLSTYVGLILLLINKTTRNKIKTQFTHYIFYILFLLVFISPTILSCVFVFPREHYIYLQMLFFVLIIISILNPLLPEKINVKAILLGLFLICLCVCPSYSKYPFLKMDSANAKLCNKKMIRLLQQNFKDKPHTLFTNMPFVKGMLPENFQEVNTIFDKKKLTPYAHYADSAKIDIVIVNASLLRDPHIIYDSTWISFFNDPATRGFKPLHFSECETYLLIKE